ncbi:extensin family protein [Yoonia maritima]|uniref:extensin-like domain-containing protein n=1 Tax=Yoonia maritima TaxID=1435347 RepID=UPI001EF8EA07|nr:extensin family protein [Yoonia maritima]
MVAGHQLLMHPNTPLPSSWNPVHPLKISDPLTPFTQWKLSQAASEPAVCLRVLEEYSSVTAMSDFEHTDQCYIRNRVEVSGVGDVSIDAVETSCPIALRLAMWEHHSLQPAAMALLGVSVQKINHIGSYNCRAMRTGRGETTRMSTHSTAAAIDISGFQLADGRRLSLIDDWPGGTLDAQFLHQARDGACRFFKLTLSPDYNALHADHFHLQSRGWGLCR